MSLCMIKIWLDKNAKTNVIRLVDISGNISNKFAVIIFMSQQKQATCIKFTFSYNLEENCLKKKVSIIINGKVNGKKLTTLNT